MASAVPDILARIAAVKRTGLDALRARRAELESALQARREFRDFRAAIAAHPPAVIAEVKKASPSKGSFTDSYDPASIASTYERGGAAAVSVLTDVEHFQGSLAHMQAARAAIGIPVLRKDFTLDEVHVLEAAAHGADAILLIAALLGESELRRYRELAEGYGMNALVEVHNDEELSAAIASGASIIGVNNRDLHTFEVRLETSVRLAQRIPSAVVKVAESGIHSRADVETLAAAGFQAFLVGEYLMKSPDPAAAIRDLRGI